MDIVTQHEAIHVLAPLVLVLVCDALDEVLDSISAVDVVGELLDEELMVEELVVEELMVELATGLDPEEEREVGWVEDETVAGKVSDETDWEISADEHLESDFQPCA